MKREKKNAYVSFEGRVSGQLVSFADFLGHFGRISLTGS
jgi:hypothetical protein